LSGHPVRRTAGRRIDSQLQVVLEPELAIGEATVTF
jgi:hypothetical protein